MTPRRRKILYAISFETLGIAVTAMALSLISDTPAASSLALSTLTASIALAWSYAFNTAFEAWESCQATRGRSLARRAVHAVLFEGGLVLLLLPLMAWWLDTTILGALMVEAALIAVFLVYTALFTWGFDRIFGLPASAR